MRPLRPIWILALTLLPALSGCAEPDNPYGFSPALVGHVRLDASLADAAGNPLGSKVFIHADSVRVWLIEEGQAADSTPTNRGIYDLVMQRHHTYRAQVGIRPAFVDSTEEVTAARAIAYYPDTLRLGRRGNLTSRPNPFSFQVVLEFQLAADTHVEITVHALSSKRVRVLAARTFLSGSHQLLWDGKDDDAATVPDGMYWVLLQTASETRAELVIKQP